MIRSVALLAILALFPWPAKAQQVVESFVLNGSHPYVYLKFDHVGPRTPVLPGESHTGVWIRIVNNCRVPILVQTLGGRNSKGEITVVDEIEESGQYAVRIRPYKIPIEPTTNFPVRKAAPHHAKPPLGYADYTSDVPSYARIAPGQSLLFSVPFDHLEGGDWYMRVPFSLDIPGSRGGPYSYADSFTVHIPSKYTQQGPARKEQR